LDAEPIKKTSKLTNSKSRSKNNRYLMQKGRVIINRAKDRNPNQRELLIKNKAQI
jgi:hypothetical protein